MTLREIIYSQETTYGDLRKLILKRDGWIKGIYARIDDIDGVETFVYFVEEETIEKMPIPYPHIIANDWYIVKNEKEDKDISDRLTKLKYKLVDTINEVINTLED